MTLPRIAEYGTQIAKDNMSVDTLIRTETRKNDYGRIITWKLSSRTPGYTAAGSCLRLQEKLVYRVTTFDARENTTHGQSFLTLDEAEKYLAALGELVQ